MKIQKTIISEKGSILSNPKEGFILYGCVFVSEIDEAGMPTGGLLGDAKTAEKIIESGVEPKAYSVREFIEALNIDPFELSRIADGMKPKTRTPLI
jgi:hypothetical protein